DVFREIWARHVEALERYITTRVGRAAAEDLISSTFLAGFRYRRTYKGAISGHSAGPWLLGIATNEISQHRRLEQRWLDQQAAGAQQLDVPTNESDAVLGALASHSRVARALRDLAPRYRDPFLLLVLADLDYAQIAVALSLRIGTVRSRIHRARTELGRQMKEDTNG
ncbi:MAG: polymerase ECF-subfamily sigma factor, partial [Thermoleophilia bacterium]|nr:polymerase ECF-subfamily sigma factor [Thermoleophilia bacterium]